MSTMGLFYGSDSGNTQDIAKKIGKKLGIAAEDIGDISSKQNLEDYDILFLGTPSQGLGDLQSDWETFGDKLKELDLSGKKIALFGCGDSISYSDTFCGAVGKLYNLLLSTNATFIGSVSTDGYTYDDSEAIVDGSFVGLVLDEDNESEKTDERIESWIKSLDFD